MCGDVENVFAFFTIKMMIKKERYWFRKV